MSEPRSKNEELIALRKLWLVLSLLAVLVSLNVFAATQGGDVHVAVGAALTIEFDKSIPEAIAALWGIMLLTVFVGAANLVLAAHARRSDDNWSDRYPFRIGGLSTRRGIGRAAQCFAIVLLTGLPVYTLGHSWNTMLTQGKLCSEVFHQGRTEGWQFDPSNPSLFFSDVTSRPSRQTRLTSNHALGPSQKNGVQECLRGKMTDYRAPSQSWIMASLSLMAAGAGLWAMLWVVLGERLTSRVTERK